VSFEDFSFFAVTQNIFFLPVDQPKSAQAAPYRTSESDFSESEANRIKVDRHRQSKLRQTALSLICTMAQKVDKRQMFGYWHSIFPYEQVTPKTASLLTCICRDPSTRCRMVAVQATSFMLYKSKPYLVQAETEKVASNFTPFSVALGNMICNMFESLTHALAHEGDNSVLTQILKCLSVFIQATPFHHLRSGIVTKFVRYVRKLVWNKDPTVKVGALMVMGYLLSVDVMTPEILECIGSTTAAKVEDVSTQQTDIDDEEIIESDDEEEQAVEVVVKATGSKLSISWLLQTALEHLGVQVSPYMVRNSNFI
jgi:HEAT repeat-containing protein 6